MDERASSPSDDSPPLDYSKERNYYYTVLNLSKQASLSEIHERHRALSLVFHPDKQHDESLKEVSTKKFLEIQKAYQGEEGLGVRWPVELKAKSTEEIDKILKDHEVVLRRKAVTSYFLPKATASCAINATPLFLSAAEGRAPKILAQELEYSLERRIAPRTSLLCGIKANSQNGNSSIRYVGTVRHQFSPRLTSLLSVDLFSPYTTKLHVNHEGPDHSLDVKAFFLPLKVGVVPPLINISLKRRLFRLKPQSGLLSLQTGHNPSISFLYHTPTLLNGAQPGHGPGGGGRQGDHEQLLSTRGLRFAVLERNVGIAFDTILPKLVAEVALTLPELSTRFRACIHYGLTGAFLFLSGQWSNDTTELGASVSTGATGVTVTLECQYLEQRLSVPITLSTEPSPELAFGAIILPSTLLFMGYRFVIVPRRRARRKLAIQRMKKELEEGSESIREYRAAQALMKDSVKRQRKLESSRDGLVILEAWYGVIDTDDTEEDVLLDVTDALQALVRNSQLYIPGGETKAVLRGFSDPAPFASKILRVRYSFRSRLHYADIADDSPVVLPLQEHQITDQG